MAKHVFIFVPAFGNDMKVQTAMSIFQLQGLLAQKAIGTSFSCMSFPDIAELRSMVATIWHDTMPQVDYLLFIDSDMAFPAELVLDMLLLDEPIVGTIYRQRKEPVSWAGSGSGEPVTERRGNFMKVEGVGMGVTLIRKDAMKIMLEKFPDIVDGRLSMHPANALLQQAGCNRLIRAFEKLDIKERGIISEDLSFCIRWQQCGGSVWAAINYDVHHIGDYDYSGNYLQHITQAGEQAIMQQEMMRKQLEALAQQQNWQPPAVVIGDRAAEATPVAAVEVVPLEAVAVPDVVWPVVAPQQEDVVVPMESKKRAPKQKSKRRRRAA